MWLQVAGGRYPDRALSLHPRLGGICCPRAAGRRLRAPSRSESRGWRWADGGGILHVSARELHYRRVWRPTLRVAGTENLRVIRDSDGEVGREPATVGFGSRDHVAALLLACTGRRDLREQVQQRW